MLATLFRKTTTPSFVYAAGLLLAAVTYRYTYQFEWRLDAERMGSFLLEGGLALFTLLISNMYFRAYGFLKENNFFLLFFALIYCFLPASSYPWQEWLGLIALFWAGVLYERVPWKKSPEKNILDISLTLSLATLFDPINVLFFFLFYVGLFSNELKKTQFFLIPAITVALLAFAVVSIGKLFELDVLRLHRVTQIDMQNLGLLIIGPFNFWMVGKACTMGYIISATLRPSRYGKQQKKAVQMLLGFCLLSLGLTVFLLEGQQKELFFLPLIVFVAYRLLAAKRTTAQVNLWVTFLIIILWLRQGVPF